MWPPANGDASKDGEEQDCAPGAQEYVPGEVVESGGEEVERRVFLRQGVRAHRRQDDPGEEEDGVEEVKGEAQAGDAAAAVRVGGLEVEKHP